MGIAPEGYIPRVVDAQIEKYLSLFGAVEIAGTKWCGKTWSARRHAESIVYVDQGSNSDLARSDPKMMLLGERPHVIDEWQRVPAIWDAVRHEVDEQRRTKGAWILTGSSSPRRKDARGHEETHHSGAGRIGRVKMLPMTLSEMGASSGSVSLAGLFEGKFSSQTCDADTQALVELVCHGGWPEAIESSVEDAMIVAREYLDLIVNETVPDQGKDPFIAGRLCGSIARNLGQAVTYKTMIGYIFGGEDDPLALISEDTVGEYLRLLGRLYLVEEIPGWAPPARAKKRFATKPKRYFTDPSLAVALLGMNVQSLIDDWQTFGLVFENLCVRDITVYARALEGASSTPVRYYRDDAGLEVDLIIELTDGRWAAIEVKVSEDKVADGERSLIRMRDKVCGNPRARVRQPEFMAVVTGVSGFARQLESGVYVIPVRCLAP